MRMMSWLCTATNVFCWRFLSKRHVHVHVYMNCNTKLYIVTCTSYVSVAWELRSKCTCSCITSCVCTCIYNLSFHNYYTILHMSTCTIMYMYQSKKAHCGQLFRPCWLSSVQYSTICFGIHVGLYPRFSKVYTLHNTSFFTITMNYSRIHVVSL